MLFFGSCSATSRRSQATNCTTNESLLEQVDLIQLLNFSMDLLGGWSDQDLEDRQVLKEALEQYSLAYDMQAELAIQVAAWETTLRREYDRMESAASNIDVDLEELADEEEDDLEDEPPE
ncbi:MAG TPA: hypothetical protein VEL31_06860 [Ktedonobacteraceae bacterium]|nr:hypothetical protein [Ktedonobacteraceae bacterium]